MNFFRVLAPLLGLIVARLVTAAPDAPFQARHFPYEPRPLLLTHPDYQDVLRGAKVEAMRAAIETVVKTGLVLTTDGRR